MIMLESRLELALAAAFALTGLPVSTAQTVLPFPPEGEHLLWKYSRTGGALLSAYHQYAYDGEDVELDGQVYKLIRISYRYEVAAGQGTTYVDESYHVPYCHLRTNEDGVTYIHSTEHPPEEVLFDTSIGVGETVPASWSLIRRDWYDEVVTVASIEMMIDDQGTPRRVWHMDAPNLPGPLAFIEGVGCTQEFLGIPFTTGPLSELLCVTYDESPIIAPACTSITVGVNTPVAPMSGPLRVIPRPGTTSYGMSRPCSGTIHDALGRVMTVFGPGQEFHMDDARTGIYVLRSADGDLVRFFHDGVPH